VTQATPLLTQFSIFCLVPLRIVLRAKFGVSSFTPSGDMEGVPKFKKVGHVTQATPLLTQFYIFCLVPLTILLREKFGVFSFMRSGDMEGSQNLKIRSRDPGHAPLYELHIFS